MFELKNVSYSNAGKNLFSDVSFSLNAGETVGLAGKNGAGKTTLLNIIAGYLAPDYGTIFRDRNCNLFYLDSKELLISGSSIEQILAPDWYQSKVELRKCQDELGNSPLSQTLLDKYESLFERFDKWGGYCLEAELENRLNNIGLTKHTLTDQFDKLSGGEKIKVRLSGLLSGNYSVVLLDEPTNNLDLCSRKWLIKFLRSRSEAYLIVSHDRDFLDSVCTRTIVLDAVAKTVTSYSGNYSWAVNRRKEEKEREKKEYEVQKRFIKRMEEDVRETKEQALKTESETTNDYIRKRSKKVALKAKAREHRLNKIIESKKITLLRESPKSKFKVLSCEKRNSTLLYCKSIDVGFKERLLINDLTLELKLGDRLAITGNNGVGKSFLLKTLLGLNKPMRGEVVHSEHHSTGYMSQSRLENCLNKSIIDLFRERVPNSSGWTDGNIREHLSSIRIFLVDGRKKVSELSEGERTKLELSLILLSNPSLLMLDEPTNHLDIETIEEIESTLNLYKGALIVVTHDRRLIAKIKPHLIWEISNQSVQVKTS